MLTVSHQYETVGKIVSGSRGIGLHYSDDNDYGLMGCDAV
jgi:hypothetical protein